MISPASLVDFVRESNRIERILHDPTPTEIQAHVDFLATRPTIESLKQFVGAVQPDARIRDHEGLDVAVGRYLPPRGGPEIASALEAILFDLSDPFLAHQRYEALHPFTDGNGRSGRVLWLWTMGGINRVPLGFLHHWYYQSLQFYCQVPVW